MKCTHNRKSIEFCIGQGVPEMVDVLEIPLFLSAVDLIIIKRAYLDYDHWKSIDNIYWILYILLFYKAKLFAQSHSLYWVYKVDQKYNIQHSKNFLVTKFLYYSGWMILTCLLHVPHFFRTLVTITAVCTLITHVLQLWRFSSALHHVL